MASDFNLDQFPLPKDWTRQELVDCTEDGNISYGIVQPGKNLDVGTPVLRVNNIGNNSLDLETVMKVDPKIEKKYLRTRLLGGEVLLTLVGSTGQSIIAPEYMKGWNVARAIAVIRADENIGADWINICLQSRETHHYLNSRANTTVQKTLNLRDVRSIPIPIPPLKTKLFIEKIATSLSKKIELNRQMNETLEAMAQALFKSWFVDFDPVIDNALAAGNAIPDEFVERAEQRKAIEKQDNSDINNLFPDAFEFTEEMGWIPEGWEVTPVYEIAEFINGSSFKSQYFSDENEGLPIIKIAEIKNGVSQQTKFTTQEMPKKYFIDDGSILFSWSGNPDTSIDTFIWTGGEGWLNQHIFNVVLHKNNDRTFVYYLLKMLKPVFTEIARDKQTTGLGHVTIKDMKRTYTIKPSDLALEAFELHSNSIFERWYQNLFSSRELTRLRDTLLPKLMSGELRVPDAAAMVEEA